MTTTMTTDSRKFPPRTLILLAACGGVVGALIGASMAKLLRHMHISPRDIGWTDAIALWIAAVFVASSLLFAYLSTNRRQLAQMFEGQHAVVPATSTEVQSALLQMVVLALAGLLLAAPIVVHKVVLESRNVGTAVFCALLALFALQTWANVALWRRSDEFVRQMMMETAGWSFGIGQGLLFLWAAAEHLQLVRPVSAWNLYSLLMLLYLVSGAAVTVRQNRC